MRRCGRSEELWEALAAEEPLAPALEAHAATCAECGGMRALARRFESRLETTMSELVTDALPLTTGAAAHMAPHPSRRRSPGIVLSVVATAAVVVFAAVGLVATGVSISDAVGGDSVVGSASPDAGVAVVDCFLGEPAVDVVAGGDADAEPAALIAYCLDDAGGEPGVEGRAVTCVRSLGRGGWGTRDPDGERTQYLGACTQVVDVEIAEDDPAERPVLQATALPFVSWDHAAGSVAWPVLRPGWLPDGYEIAALQGFATADAGPIESVTAMYLHNGTPLSIEQVALTDPDAFRVELTIPGAELGNVSTGRTVVDGRPAFWAAGVAVPTVGYPDFDVDTLVLTWSDGQVGYKITSRIEELSALRRIAESFDRG